MIYKINILSKHFCFLILFTVFTSCISKTKRNNDVSDEEFSNMSFKHKAYSFGKINIKKSVCAVFEFSNTGKNPLLIKEVTTSCGCTVPEWYKGIIKPNESGEIKIIYDAKYPGRFNKTVTVFYNGKDSPIKLTIKGEVPYPQKQKY